VEETVTAETDRQIAEINKYRRRGNKLTRSVVVEKMLAMWNRVNVR
jgi:hypothetical protein